MQMLREYRNNGYSESYIAVIDANYDEDGNQTSDATCIGEIWEVE